MQIYRHYFCYRLSTLYFCWIFSGQPYYEDACKLEVKKDYVVKGWLIKQTSEGNFNLEITNVPKPISYEVADY